MHVNLKHVHEEPLFLTRVKYCKTISLNNPHVEAFLNKLNLWTDNVDFNKLTARENMPLFKFFDDGMICMSFTGLISFFRI